VASAPASLIKDGSAKPHCSHERLYLTRFGRRPPASVMSIKVRWRLVVEKKEAGRATTFRVSALGASCFGVTQDYKPAPLKVKQALAVLSN
jgi:hypothetical protein